MIFNNEFCVKIYNIRNNINLSNNKDNLKKELFNI